MKQKKLLTSVLFGILGTGNAAYLTYQAYGVQAQTAASSFCDFNATFSCSSVFGFDFAWIFGIPFPLIALFVYPAIALVAYLGYVGKIQKHFQILLAMAIGGLLFNGYIIFNETLVGAYCPLCLMCTAMIATIGVMSVIWIREQKWHK